MLKDKTIKIFNTDSKNKGDIIKFCYTEWGDEGEREDGKYMNGLIREISEASMTIVTVDPLYDGEHVITIEKVLEDKVRLK